MASESAPQTIWKYELAITDAQLVAMPAGAELLHVGAQRMEVHEPGQAGVWDALTLWARVDVSAPMVGRLIAVVGTGHLCPNPDEGVYVGTAQCGAFVWHVFDGGEADG